MLKPTERSMNLPFNLKESWRIYRQHFNDPEKFADHYNVWPTSVKAMIAQMERMEKYQRESRAEDMDRGGFMARKLVDLMGAFSVREYADYVGINHAKLYRVLLGRSRFYFDEVVMIASYHNLPLEAFIEPAAKPRRDPFAPDNSTANVSDLTNRNDIV